MIAAEGKRGRMVVHPPAHTGWRRKEASRHRVNEPVLESSLHTDTAERVRTEPEPLVRPRTIRPRSPRQMPHMCRACALSVMAVVETRRPLPGLECAHASPTRRPPPAVGPLALAAQLGPRSHTAQQDATRCSRTAGVPRVLVGTLAARLAPASLSTDDGSRELVPAEEPATERSLRRGEEWRAENILSNQLMYFASR